jgi:hypothetical protein
MLQNVHPLFWVSDNVIIGFAIAGGDGALRKKL